MKQGCALSTILFCLGLQVILDEVKSTIALREGDNRNTNLFAYADDTHIICSYDKADEYLKLATSIFEEYGLKINASKTKIVTNCKASYLYSITAKGIPEAEIEYLNSISTEGTIILGIPCGNRKYIQWEIKDALEIMNSKLQYINDTNFHSNARFCMTKYCINPSLVHLIRQFYDGRMYANIDENIDNSIAALLQVPKLETHSKVIRSLTGDLGGLGIYNYDSGYGKILYHSLQESTRKYIESHPVCKIDINFISFSNSELHRLATDIDSTSDTTTKKLTTIQLHRLKDHEHHRLMSSLSTTEESSYIVENIKGASYKGSGELFNFNNLGYRIKTNVYSAILKNRLNVAITNLPKIPACSAGPKEKTCGYDNTKALRYGHYIGNCRDHIKQWTESHNLLRDKLASNIQKTFANVDVTRECTQENVVAQPNTLTIKTPANTYKRGDIKVSQPALTFIIDCAITTCTLGAAMAPYKSRAASDVPSHQVNDKYFAISAKEVSKKSLYKNQQNFVPFVVNNQGLIGREGMKILQLLDRHQTNPTATNKKSPFITTIQQEVIRICAIRSAYERIRSEAYFARLTLQ